MMGPICLGLSLPLIDVTVSTGPGTADVTETIPGVGLVSYVYTIEFIAPTLAGPQPLITVTPSSPRVLSSVDTVADGAFAAIVSSGATLGLDGDPLGISASISIPALDRLALNGTGVGNLGALRNLSGNNTWNGSITLQTSSSIGANPNTQLTATGTVQEVSPAPTPPASVVPVDLTKVGTGALVFPNANTYTGDTVVSAGILNVRNPLSLGHNASAIQTITVSGTSGQFRLFFADPPYNGISSSLISVAGLNAATLKNAIDAMLANATAPGGGTATVNVVQQASGNVFAVYYGNTPADPLYGKHVPMLIAPSTFFTGNAQASTNLVNAGGASRTYVQTGATLQMQGGFAEASGKILTLSGLGFNNMGALDSVSGANTWNASPIVLAGNAGIGSDANTLFVDQVITDNFQRQTLVFNGFSAGNVYNLSFGGLTTPNLSFSGSAAANAAAIQNALNSLATVALEGTLPTAVGEVPSVTVVSLGGGSYRIEFNRAMAGKTWPDVIGTRVTGTGSFSNVALAAGTNAFGVTKFGVGTVQLTGSTSNTYSGLTDVHQGMLELNKLAGAIAVPANLQVGDGVLPPGAAAVRFLQDNQNPTTTNVVVNSDGVFDLNNHTDTVTGMTINGGLATTGPAAGGTLNVTDLTMFDGTFNLPGAGATVNIDNNLNMTGGTINLNGAGSKIQLNAGLTKTITATSSVLGAATINGQGTLQLGNALKTFNVNNGPAASDMAINSVINGNVNLLKTGPGRLELNAVNTYTGVTQIDAGDVQVDELGIQRLTLTSFVAGNQFNLTYSNNNISGTTSPAISYTGTPATDAASIFNALTNLLASIFMPGTVSVTPVSATVFDIAFTGTAKINLNPLTPSIVSGSGTANVQSVNDIGLVTLNGGSISGNGATGAISGSGGMIAPGLNGLAQPTGILEVNGAVAMNTNTTFFVEVSNVTGNHPAAQPGFDNDQLYVNGNVNLNNALLTGNVIGGNVQIGDTFTILKTSGSFTVSGSFDGIINSVRTPIAQDGTVFLNGQKFTVHYFSNSVVLTRQFATISTLTFSSSANPSVYGQQVTITAVAIPEPGATFATADAQVTFTVDGFSQATVPVSLAGIASFQPQDFFGVVWAPFSTHTITAFLTDNNNVFQTKTGLAFPTPSLPTAATDLVQAINRNTVTISAAVTPTPTSTAPVYGQDILIDAAVTTVVTPNVNAATNPTGNVRFTIDPSSPSPLIYTIPINPYLGPPAVEHAIATVLGNLLLSPGSHTIELRYLGDVNYADTISTPVTLTVVIQRDNAVVNISGAPSNLGQNATFFVSVTPGQAGSIGVPQGTVTFYDGSTSNPALGSVAYTGGTVSFSTAVLAAGNHNIIATFAPSDNKYNASQGNLNPFVVNKAPTLTVISSTTPSSPTFGQQVTFTITVSENPDIPASFGVVSGTVTLWDGPVGTGVNLGTSAINTATGQAQILTSPAGLSVGTHTINAVYSGNTNFATSTGTIGSFVVSAAATTTTVTASSPGGANFNTPVTFTAMVTSAIGAIPPGTHVIFWDGPVGTGVNLGSAVVNASSQATSPAVTLSAGAHTINAVFVDDNDGNVNFATSTGTLANYKINNAPTTTTLVTNPPVPSGTAVYGESITFRASVTSPGGTVGVGRVTFRDGAVTLGVVNVDASGIADLVVTNLNAGSHNLTASYTDQVDTFFTGPTTNGVLNPYVVNQASTEIQAANFTSSAPTSAQGLPVTFTAKVTTLPPSGAVVNAGTVTFWDGPVGTGINLGSGTVNATTGIATLTTSALTLGTHTINAKYNGATPNFIAAAPQSLTQVVKRGTAVTFNPIVAPNNAYALTLNFSVNVAASAAPLAPAPSGDLTITEVIAGVPTVIGSFTGYTGGTVTIPVSGLSAGTHTLTLNYTGDATFAPSSKTITQTVTAAATTATLANLSSVFYGNAVTFVATITSTTAPNPTVGTVTFRETFGTVTTILGTVNLGNVTPGSNVAEFTTTATQLRQGSHTITAIYNNTGNTNYASSPVSVGKTQAVNAATTQAVLSPVSPISYGNPVTFTATVSSTSPGSPGVPPGGTVTFRRTFGATTVIMGTVPINTITGVASITVNGLVPGSHTIRATYNGFAPNFAVSPPSTAEVQVVNKADTAVSLTPSVASGTSTFGKSVQFTALVSVTSGGTIAAPTGTVSFFGGATGTTLLGTATLVKINATTARAILTTTATGLSAITHQIRAQYNGSTVHATASQTISYTVNQAVTATTLTSTPTYWPAGGTTTFTAVVAATSGGAPGVPTGTVTFFVDSAPQVTVTLASGKATTGIILPQGSHTVTATYNPTTIPVQNFALSNSNILAQDVRKATAINFTSSSNYQGVNITATVTTTAAGGPPTGSVNFYENGVLLGTATVDANGRAFIFLPLTSGTHKITATYSGDTNFNPATITKSIAGRLVGRLV